MLLYLSLAAGSVSDTVLPVAHQHLHNPETSLEALTSRLGDNSRKRSHSAACLADSNEVDSDECPCHTDDDDDNDDDHDDDVEDGRNRNDTM